VADNAAHSNLFYGLRVHPEFYPLSNPCDQSKFNMVGCPQALCCCCVA
jgi:hypothetical protein